MITGGGGTGANGPPPGHELPPPGAFAKVAPAGAGAGLLGGAGLSDVSITVRGAFESSYRPERATVHLAVSVEGATKDTVFAAASQSAAAVAGSVTPLLDAESGPVTWWASDQVRTWSHRPWAENGRQLPQVHHAAVDFQIRFSDFEALSRWLAGVAGLPGVSVTGIDWTLTDQRRAQLLNQVRAAAVLDAREKAQSYAGSLGLSLLRPVAVADVGMLGDGREGTEAAPSPRMALASRTSMRAEAAEISFSPQDIVLDAQVDARFVAG